MGRPEGIGGESDTVARRAGVGTSPDSTDAPRRIIPRDPPVDDSETFEDPPVPTADPDRTAAEASADTSDDAPAEPSENATSAAPDDASGEAVGEEPGEAPD